jgi:hypothetical protein
LSPIIVSQPLIFGLKTQVKSISTEIAATFQSCLAAPAILSRFEIFPVFQSVNDTRAASASARIAGPLERADDEARGLSGTQSANEIMLRSRDVTQTI